MTDSSQEAPPPPERSRRRPVQDRGSTVSMTSTTTGLPDRYRPIDQVGPDEPTPTAQAKIFALSPPASVAWPTTRL